MSEKDTPDPHTALYQQIHENMSNQSMLYEHLMTGVIAHLPGSRPQVIEDALNMMCVSLSKTPLESLLLIHEFLDNYQGIMQREQEEK